MISKTCCAPLCQMKSRFGSTRIFFFCWKDVSISIKSSFHFEQTIILCSRPLQLVYILWPLALKENEWFWCYQFDKPGRFKCFLLLNSPWKGYQCGKNPLNAFGAHQVGGIRILSVSFDVMRSLRNDYPKTLIKLAKYITRQRFLPKFISYLDQSSLDPFRQGSIVQFYPRFLLFECDLP